MSDTVEEYARRWRPVVDLDLDMLVGVEVTPRSVVILETARSTPMGEGAFVLRDFGDAICFYRYFRVPYDLNIEDETQPSPDADLADMLPGLAMIQESWEQRRPHETTAQLRARLERALQALDALLAEYTRDGFNANMPERLQVIVNTAMIDFELDTVFVMPDDLEALLTSLGNPLVDYDSDDDDPESAAPAFDLTNPAHREALREEIESFGL